MSSIVDSSAGIAPRKGRSRLPYGVLALGTLSCVLVLALFAWQTARERSERIDREKEALSRMAEIVASDAANRFDRIRFFLETADFWLRANPKADPRTDREFRELIEKFLASSGGQLGIRVVSASGGIYNLTAPSLLPVADVRDRDYYRVQQSEATRGFFVGRPVLSRVTGTWTMPISYPLSARNAGMSLIAATIEMTTFDDLYGRIRPKPAGSIALIRGDGTILARSPFVKDLVGRPIAQDVDSWWRALRSAPGKTWTLRADTDDEDRIIVSRIAEDPLFVATVTARYGDVLAPWVASLWWRILAATLMAAAIAFASIKLFVALRSLDEAQVRLRSNLDRLALSDATKDKLFSVIAHDLRGPIGGMGSLLETMAIDRDRISPEELAEIVDALRAAARNTSQLLENLLAWSRSQRGELAFRPERVSVRPVVEECAELFALSAAEKGVSIAVEVDESLEAKADEEQLKILARNLVSNAVKFSIRGARIRVEGAKVEGGTRLDVHDEGVGMEPAQLEALFSGDSPRSRPGTANERGSGLGFVLCREIVELHGGRIEARSEPGRGSVFSVFLPD